VAVILHFSPTTAVLNIMKISFWNPIQPTSGLRRQQIFQPRTLPWLLELNASGINLNAKYTQRSQNKIELHS